MAASLRVLDALDGGLEFESVEAGLAALERHGDLLPASPTRSSVAAPMLELPRETGCCVQATRSRRAGTGWPFHDGGHLLVSKPELPCKH
jgi:hypothetical protein